MIKGFYICLTILSLSQAISSLSLVPREGEVRKNTNLNETEVDRLAFQQTEAIKKIISDSQQVQLDHAQAQEKPTEPRNQPNKTEINLEELRAKCKHLENMLRLNESKFDEKRSESEYVTPPSSRYPPYPVYFRTKKDKNKATPPSKAFYITRFTPNITTSTTPPPTKDDESNNVKYIKLEPVILQKTFLTNGKVVYYWHKSLPTAMQYSQQPEKERNVATTTVRPTTAASSGIYSFKNFFPFSIGNSDSYEPSSTTTTTTTPKYSDFEDLATQLKFVVPLPYGNPENYSRDPWSFDQFAYYPMPMQPNRVNVRVPYVPTFHVIKALAVPDKYLSSASSEVNEDKHYSDFKPSSA
ncbi:hypothetical protein HHI36_020752 [Cryptolaemus montrouzieri]|uniref:Uncharacterized protein n=1 Tax=Cryptolaemus montrouzieri TaxID=559131 RepID=A0ABD2NBM1_9CUCU